jgi:uncharacterized protein (DUF433 family)
MCGARTMSPPWSRRWSQPPFDGALKAKVTEVKPGEEPEPEPEGSQAMRYNRGMPWQDRVSVNPAVRSGKPCIKGTRITVYDVLEYLAGGMTEDMILSDFPDLTRDDIRAALAFAAARERRLANSVA